MIDKIIEMVGIVRRRFLGGLAALGGLLAASCREWFGQGPVSEYIEKHIVVDDAFIDNCLAKPDAYCVVEYLLFDIDTEDEEKYYKSLSRLSIEQTHLFAILLYEMEVNNGGHEQFYWNSAGIAWEEVLNGLRAIGADEHYELMKESVQIMGGNPSKDREIRQRQIPSDSSRLDGLDWRFYDLRKTGVLDDAEIAYVKNNRGKFYFDGVVKDIEWPSNS